MANAEAAAKPAQPGHGLLVITDCDEVLLHMIVPFQAWLAQEHGITFHINGNDFARAMFMPDGTPVEQKRMWELLDEFFDTQMHRQTPIPGAFEAMRALSEHADVVVLTNLEHRFNAARTRQLADLGLALRVFTNQGPKGPAIQKILDEYAPRRAIFIDDIAAHHGSAAQLTPDVRRLHLCGEPQLAPHIACAHVAGHAHARIDDWHGALPWLLAQITTETTND